MSNLNALRRSGVGRCQSQGADNESLEDYEDSTRAVRPSDVGGMEKLTDEHIGRFRDTLIVQLRRRGITLRNIAETLNVGHVTVYNRLRAIPPDVRKYYESASIF